MASITQIGPDGCFMRRDGSFADKQVLLPKWNFILELDPNYPDNMNTLFHVRGIAVLQNMPGLPGLPPGTM